MASITVSAFSSSRGVAGFASLRWVLVALAFVACLTGGVCAQPTMAFADEQPDDASSASASTDSDSPQDPDDQSASSSASSSSSAAGKEAPVADDPFKGAVTVDVDDGIYLVDVTLEGGTGKATIASPAEFEVFDGRGALTAEWSSEYYDYMLVGGMKYLRTNESGGSRFVIPVLAYNEPFDVVGDTTAMSEAHEIAYRITVDLNSIKPYEPEVIGSSPGVQEDAGGLSMPWIVFIVCMVLSAGVIATIVVLMRNYRKHPEV